MTESQMGQVESQMGQVEFFTEGPLRNLVPG